MPVALPASVEETLDLLAAGHYVGERSLATALYLSLKLNRPLFLEGEAGVGKTEIAKVLSETLGRKLVRLQCYEGLDVASAVYEWNYARQMIEIRLAEAVGDKRPMHRRSAKDVFSDQLPHQAAACCRRSESDDRRPAGAADRRARSRTDEPFEAYLLEVLSDFQITIPELGVMKADQPPIVIITSNRTREIHDALKRRCFYHWVDYPDAERERRIVEVKAPGTPAALSAQIVGFIQKLRQEDLFKQPGIAETLDWAQALTELDALELDPAVISDTLGTLLKYQDDIEKIQGEEAGRLLNEVKAELAATG